MSELRWLLDNVPEDSIEEHALDIEAAIKENDALANNLRVIQTTNDELRNTVKSLRELARDYITAYEKLAFAKEQQDA